MRGIGARLVLTTTPRWLPPPDDPGPAPPHADQARAETYNRLVSDLISYLASEFGDTRLACSMRPDTTVPTADPMALTSTSSGQ